MQATIAGIRLKFSDVSHMSTEDLAEKVNTKGPDSRESQCNLVILDCRERNEFEVSRLPGAIWVEPSVKAGELVAQNPAWLLSEGPNGKGKEVVCYCSVGYRSSLVAREVNKALDDLKKVKKGEGNQDGSGQAPAPTEDQIKVYNLEGSIFKWANEARPMVDSQGQPTQFVHPYNAAWGLLVDSKLRKYHDAGVAPNE